MSQPLNSCAPAQGFVYSEKLTKMMRAITLATKEYIGTSEGQHISMTSHVYEDTLPITSQILWLGKAVIFLSSTCLHYTVPQDFLAVTMCMLPAFVQAHYPPF